MTQFAPDSGASILGTRVARIEDPRLVTGRATYTAGLADPRLAGSAIAVFVRSPIAHARIRSLQTATAAAAPGVVAVLTAPDLGLPAATPMYDTAMAEPYLAEGVVRYAGQPVAVVVADSETAAADAVELVAVDYEPLPALVDVEEAARDEVVLFPEIGTNIAATHQAGADAHLSDDELFAGCDVVVSQRIVNNRVAPAPLEGRAAAAVWAHEAPGEDPTLTIWLPNQGAQHAKRNLVEWVGDDPRRGALFKPPVGGA
jgi:carbon-monoxide dehydrogenase large subunit